mgnify:CR=1 FL=1
MFSCGLLDRPCWAELKYARILAVEGSVLELWLLKVQDNWISGIFSLTGWQVWYSDRLTGLVLCQVDRSGTLTDWQVY